MALSLPKAIKLSLKLSNVISLPIRSVPENGDSEAVLVALTAVVMSVTILVEKYVDIKATGRSLADEQVGVYEAVAENLHTQFGLDGRACVLRFICELQQRHLGRRTMAGKLLTVLFTPCASEMEGQLYLAAKGLGNRKDAPCASHYGSCPHSVFLYFEALRNLTTTCHH